jgi:hypothetical protein
VVEVVLEVKDLLPMMLAAVQVVTDYSHQLMEHLLIMLAAVEGQPGEINLLKLEELEDLEEVEMVLELQEFQLALEPQTLVVVVVEPLMVEHRELEDLVSSLSLMHYNKYLKNHNGF